MLVLCYGIPRSGSTLAFELVKGTLQSAGFEQETFLNDRLGPERLKLAGSAARNYVQGLSRRKISALIQTIGPNRKIAVKTHSPFHERQFRWIEQLQSAGDLQVVASYRDPRDICLSLVDAGEKSRQRGGRAFAKLSGLQHAQENVQRRIEEFRRWSSLKGTLRLGYETTVFSPDTAIDLVERTLGIKTDHQLAKTYAFSVAHPHKNKGDRERHRVELSEPQNAEMLKIFGEFIDRVCNKNDQSWFDEYRRSLLGARHVETDRAA
jgi:hypothetical protein